MLAPVLALAAALAAAAPSPRAAASCPSCHVVLVLLSGVRADSLTPERMPLLHARSRSAVRLRDAVSASSWSLPASATVMTGLEPSRHGLVNLIDFDEGSYATMRPALPARASTLAERLRGAGWRTGLFIAHGQLLKSSGLERGFERVVRASSTRERVEPVEEALAWARETGEKPAFLAVVSDTPQAPGVLDAVAGAPPFLSGATWKQLHVLSLTGTLFGLTAREARAARVRHDAVLRALDRRLDALLSGLERALPPERTAVLVVSSNGLSLGEHDDFSFGSNLFEESVRVPWLVWGPGLSPREVPEQVRLLDLAPTVLEWVGVPLPPDLPGRPLTGLLRGERAPALDAVSETTMLRRAHLAALRGADGWKLILDRRRGRRRLYRLADDPLEERDLSSAEPTRVREMTARLEAVLAPTAP